MDRERRVVVITGSARGIGYGLAEAFLARGCRVVVSGRTRESVGRAWITPLRVFLRFFQPRYWRRNAVAGTALDTLGRSPERAREARPERAPTEDRPRP